MSHGSPAFAAPFTSAVAMTMEEKIGQMLLVGFQGLEAPDHVLDWLARGRVSGVILFARNVESPAQLARLCDSIHRAAKYPVLIAIDQEGGTVARLRDGFSESPGALALAAIRDDRAGHVERASAVLAAEMRALGINWVFAPSLDLLHNTENPTLGTRSFGTDPAVVGELGAAAVKGFQSEGVAACPKHFPGLGATAIDTHLALPRLTVSKDELLKTDVLPYRDAVHAGTASIMTTHTIFSTLDTDYPATLSPILIRDLLRGELGFDGVVTTDCLEMKAIADHYGPGESAVLGALAGVDILLFSHTRAMQEQAYEGLLRAYESGRLPTERIEEAVRRVAALKAAYGIKLPLDPSSVLSAEHQAIVGAAAQAAVTRLYGELPPMHEGRVLVIEFASFHESNVLDAGGETGLNKRLHAQLPSARTVTLPNSDIDPNDVSRALDAAGQADVVVLATRNACWNAEQNEIAGALLRQSKQTVLLCLRTPFDAETLPLVQAAYCTFGDSAPSLDAAAELLAGKLTPNGQLPVALKLQ
ncbi:MAG: beta-N-acetylhexosaminidase [Anaerolineae bacterium]